MGCTDVMLKMSAVTLPEWANASPSYPIRYSTFEHSQERHPRFPVSGCGLWIYTHIRLLRLTGKVNDYDLHTLDMNARR